MNPAFPQRAYQAIIFDCDGTLTDSMPVHYIAWRRTMDRWGIEFPEDRFYALGGMPSDRIVALLAGEQGKSVDIALAAEQKEAEFLTMLTALEPIDSVVAVARHFFGQLPMAVASGGFRAIIDQQLRQIQVADLFPVVVTAEDTARHKPFPDVFLEAAARLAMPPTQCLVYEDSELGIQAAVAAGMDYIDVRTFHRPRPVAL
jgi:beta-phosphoglucomutase-like phosphatase (HAD superfamily)